MRVRHSHPAAARDHRWATRAPDRGCDVQPYPSPRPVRVRSVLSVPLSAGAGAAVALVLGFRRQQHHEAATASTEHDAAERRITELYGKAVDPRHSSPDTANRIRGAVIQYITRSATAWRAGTGGPPVWALGYVIRYIRRGRSGVAVVVLRERFGVHRFLSTWGGEAIYWRHADTNAPLRQELRQLGRRAG